MNTNPSGAMNKKPDTGPAAAGDAQASRETRFSANRKSEIVMRLIRGESLDALSRETGQPAGRLSAWRDEFIEAGKASLKSRADAPSGLTEEDRRDMQAKIGAITMENELLRGKIAHLEAGLPPALRRSKR